MRFLIADDVKINRILMEKFLSPYGNCVIAKDGNETIKIVTESWNDKKTFDIIFLDIGMPVLDGLGALKKIRSLEQMRNTKDIDKIKVIITTAQGDKSNIVEALSRGNIAAYLMKPITKQKLIDELKKLKLID